MSSNIAKTQHQSAFRSVLRAVFDAFAAIGTLWIFAIMLLIVADVVGRNFLALPITGVAEIAARSVVAIVFLMLPAAALNNTLIRADFLIRHLRRFGPATVHLMDMSFSLIGAILFALIALSAWPDTLAAWKTAEFFGVRGVWTLPTFPFRLLIVLGSAASSVAFIFTAFDSFISSKLHKGH